mmetsp:Transcript_18538/g.74003  ORF Transcript_18538/g.74003 Transcript_18538/m.74003 type:complete len:286 (-) Transcript_18538:229-1086(-)
MGWGRVGPFDAQRELGERPRPRSRRRGGLFFCFRGSGGLRSLGRLLLLLLLRVLLLLLLLLRRLVLLFLLARLGRRRRFVRAGRRSFFGTTFGLGEDVAIAPRPLRAERLVEVAAAELGGEPVLEVGRARHVAHGRQHVARVLGVEVRHLHANGGLERLGRARAHDEAHHARQLVRRKRRERREQRLLLHEHVLRELLLERPHEVARVRVDPSRRGGRAQRGVGVRHHDRLFRVLLHHHLRRRRERVRAARREHRKDEIILGRRVRAEDDVEVHEPAEELVDAGS